ncbi:17500_t:CDS:2, partial [Dentiscutata erythropus]
LNDEEVISKITELRIWQEHQIAGLTESFDGREKHIGLEKLWKYNQAMLTLVKGAKNQLVIKPTQGSWGTRDIALRYAGEADDYMMIINFDTREIKQDLQTSSTNKLALIPQKVKVSEDKYKLDWILVNNKENKSDIQRVVSKSKEEFRTEKWLVSKEEKGKIRLDKEVITSSNTQQTEWINKKKVIIVLQRLRKQNSS